MARGQISVSEQISVEFNGHRTATNFCWQNIDMADSGDKQEKSSGPDIPNGPSIDDMLEEAGLSKTVTQSEGATPLILGGTLDTVHDAIDEKTAKKTAKSENSTKKLAALALLEKLASKPSDEALRKSIEEQLAGLDLTSFERAIAQHMGVMGGLIDRSQFILEAFSSKKLLSYAIKSVPPLLELSALVEMSVDSKYKSNHSAISKALKVAKETNSAEIDKAVFSTLRSLLKDESDKAIATWIEKFVLPLTVTLSPGDSGALLAALYGRIEPNKGVSAGLKELFAQSITWITQPQNLPNLDEAISQASGMGGGSFATVLHETRKMSFEVGSPRYHLVMSLLKPRERKTVTFLSQAGILKDFSIEAIGELAQNKDSFDLISGNDSALSAIKDECRRRLKSEDLPLIHYWLLKFPNIRHWLTDLLILQRLRPQNDYLSQLVFDEGRIAGEHQAQERAAVEIDNLKNELRVLTVSEAKLSSELVDLEARYKELEQRLRNVANSANTSRDDQVRQAQIDSIKVLIEFMNAMEVSSSNDESLRSTLESTRAKLKGFGVAWRGEVGTVVSFNSQDHLASNLADGAKVKILTPCYYLLNTQSQIALVKARVLPQ